MIWQGIWVVLSVYGIALALFLAGCSSQLPKPPTGELCTINLSSNSSLCSDLTTGNTLPQVPLNQMDKWIVFPPETYKSIMDYVDELKSYVSNNKTLDSKSKKNLISFLDKAKYRLVIIYQ